MSAVDAFGSPAVQWLTPAQSCSSTVAGLHELQALGPSSVQCTGTTVQVPWTVAAVLLVLLWQWRARRRNRVLLLDFACYKPPDHLRVSLPRFMRGLRATGVSRPLPPC